MDGGPPPPLVHVLSPRAVTSSGGIRDPYAPLGWVQWTTLASARAAREEHERRPSGAAGPGGEGRRPAFGAVRLVCLVSASDYDALLPTLSRYCHRVSAYHRSAATEFASLGKELPFVQDIFDAGIDYARELTTADGGVGPGGDYYLMMTNADICLTSTYFAELDGIIADRPGARAVTVNRKTIEGYEVPEPMGDTFEARHEAASDLARRGEAMVAARRWTKHGGVDCFVLHSSIAEGLDLGRLFVGYPPWDWTLREVVETLDGSGRHRLVSRATSGGTFHFGNEAAWVPPFENIKSPPAHELAFWGGFRGDELALVPWCIIIGFPPGDPYTLRNTVECGRVFLHKEWGGNGAPRIASSDGAEEAWVKGVELEMSPLGMRESPPGTGPRLAHKMNWLRKYAPGVDAEFKSVVDVAPPADGGLQRILFGGGGGMPPIGTEGDLACDLPPCEIVRRSSLYSPRCAAGGGGGGGAGEGTDPRVSPLLVETTSYPVPAGLERFASVLDGAATGGTTRYETVLHQVEDPLTGVAGLCRQSVLTDQMEAWRRRVPYGSSRVAEPDKATSCLELWVEWHQFLTVMRYPAYRIEDADAGGVADVAGLSGRGGRTPPPGAAAGSGPGRDAGRREMRSSFTWRELYSIDPVNALKAWDLAHYHGYSYPGVDFNRLTCLRRAPACRAGRSGGPNPSCPAGTGPVRRPGGGDGGARSDRLRPPGLVGWSDRGCVERPVADPGVGGAAAGTGHSAGVRGVVSESELGALASSPGAPSDPALLGLLAATAVRGSGGTRPPPGRRGAPVAVPSRPLGTATVVCAVLLGAAAAAVVRARPARLGALLSRFLGARGRRREN